MRGLCFFSCVFFFTFIFGQDKTPPASVLASRIPVRTASYHREFAVTFFYQPVFLYIKTKTVPFRQSTSIKHFPSSPWWDRDGG